MKENRIITIWYYIKAIASLAWALLRHRFNWDAVMKEAREDMLAKRKELEELWKTPGYDHTR